MRSRVRATQPLLQARRTSPQAKPGCSHTADSTTSPSSPTHQQIVGSCVVISSQALPAGCPAGAQRHIPPHSLQLRLQPALCTLARQAAAARVLHAGWLGEQVVGWGVRKNRQQLLLGSRAAGLREAPRPLETSQAGPQPSRHEHRTSTTRTTAQPQDHLSVLQHAQQIEQAADDGRIPLAILLA